MKRRALLAALTATIPGAALPMFAAMTPEELVARSDAIVLGTLSGPLEVTDPASRRTVPAAEILPERILRNATGTGRFLIRLPEPGALRASDDILYRPGQSGLWFLRLEGAGPFLAADHPQRFVPADRAGATLDALRELLRN